MFFYYLCIFSEKIFTLASYNLHYEKFQDGTIKCIEDELPFEIPNGWEWCRLQTIASVLTDGTHKTPTYSDKGFVFLSSKNVTSGRIDWNNVMYIPESLHEELYSRLAPQVDDILLAKNGTTGVAAIVDKDCVFDIYVSLGLIRIVNKIILPKYVLYAIGSTFVQDYFKGSLKGIGVPNLHLEHIRKTLIPIPSENEQSHIVKKIEEILPYAEDINNQVDGLRYSVDSAKSKILDLAIQGKLVSQDPNDEPASVLLERIRAEKENLIKQGKLKLDKKESIIYKGDDNFYYTNPMFIRTFQEGNRFFTVFKPEKVRINIS
ncbi:Type I restriction modification DNA specificity domain-containing protein [Pseudobutyrivibrio sp. ACV-2]|nr:Type I restriction modification DNA specificity domain-containing protein [Pseudobutyrivibrio sp. ACV-2]